MPIGCRSLLCTIFQTQLQKEKDQSQVELCAKLDKLEILEKECWRLTDTQKAAEVSTSNYIMSFSIHVTIAKLPAAPAGGFGYSYDKVKIAIFFCPNHYFSLCSCICKLHI